MKRIALIGCLLAVGAGCASTKMVKNWVYPERGPIEFETVMVLVLSQDSLVRRNGEDELVKLIQRADVVPSYNVLHEQQLQSEDDVKKAVADSGVDGIIVMRPVYDRDEVSYVPGSYPAPYYSFWGYYGWAYPMAYSPGYIKNDRLVGVETNIYDASDGKLVWSGVSQTTNPKDVSKLVRETAKAVRSSMRKYGFIT